MVKKEIKKGEAFTMDNLNTKRPFINNSVPALDYYNVIGKICKNNVEKDHILSYNDY